MEAFFHDLSVGRTIHAYLVAGPEGSGKRAFAHQAAGALLCASPEGGRACGRCPACVRTQKGSHPDLIEVFPSKASMGVDDIRAMMLDLSSRPYEGGRRAVLLNRAEKMTPQAQNALLKTLEEPDAHTTFFLLCEDSTVMLQTVKSRCRAVRMRPDPSLVNKLTESGVEQTLAKELALFSGGASGRARDAVGNSAVLAARDTAKRMLAIRAPADAPGVWASLKEEKDTAPMILAWLECLFADILRASLGSASLLDASAQEARRFTTGQIQAIIHSIIRTNRMLASNVSWQNAAWPLLSAIAGEDVPF